MYVLNLHTSPHVGVLWFTLHQPLTSPVAMVFKLNLEKLPVGAFSPTWSTKGILLSFALWGAWFIKQTFYPTKSSSAGTLCSPTTEKGP